MEILTNYNQDTLQLITDSENSYSLSGFDSSVNKIKLSVFSSAGAFLRSQDLTQDLDFYISNNQLFLKPNEYLDREGFGEGNYNSFIPKFDGMLGAIISISFSISLKLESMSENNEDCDLLFSINMVASVIL